MLDVRVAHLLLRIHGGKLRGTETAVLPEIEVLDLETGRNPIDHECGRGLVIALRPDVHFHDHSLADLEGTTLLDDLTVRLVQRAIELEIAGARGRSLR